jgi:hypothetical protein
MAYFKFLKNKANTVGNPRPYAIATGTAIEKGEVVKLVNGLVVAIGDADQDDPYLGVAAEAHDGATADGRQTGLEILIYDDPADIFSLHTTTVQTLTGGSTTTAVFSGLLPATDDIWNGGMIEIVTCAADSSLVGRKVSISDHTGSGGTLTLAETLPAALASGDTIKLCPGNRAKGHYAWDLNSDGTDIDVDATGAGEALYCEGADPANFNVFFRLRLHQRGNDAAAK